MIADALSKATTIWMQRALRRCSQCQVGMLTRNLIVCVAVPLLISALGSGIHPAIAAPSKTSVACPSSDFATFFAAFAERPPIQRAFTQLPLHFGQNDQMLLGEDDMYKEKMVSKYEEIPYFKSSSGSVFSTQKERKKGNLKYKFVVGPYSEPDAFPEMQLSGSDSAVATLYLEDSGFYVRYRFKKLNKCWYLYSIVDRST